MSGWLSDASVLSTSPSVSTRTWLATTSLAKSSNFFCSSSQRSTLCPTSTELAMVTLSPMNMRSSSTSRLKSTNCTAVG